MSAYDSTPNSFATAAPTQDFRHAYATMEQTIPAMQAMQLLASGGVTMAAGSMLFGAAPAFWIALAGRLLVGLGASTMLIASLRLASEWFRPHEFATVAGSSRSCKTCRFVVLPPNPGP